MADASNSTLTVTKQTIQQEYVYAVELSNGYVKIGRTKNPEKRISKIRYSAAQFCVDVCRVHISDDVGLSTKAEIAIHRMFSEHRKDGSEFFKIPFEDAVSAIRGVGFFKRRSNDGASGADKRDALVAVIQAATPQFVGSREGSRQESSCDDYGELVEWVGNAIRDFARDAAKEAVSIALASLETAPGTVN